MLVAQCFMLVVSVALALVAYAGCMTPWLLLAFTFLIGCGTALHNPSWQASVGDMVPRADVPAAVALNSMSFNLTRSVGPAIGGAIVAAAGAAAAFAANAVSYLALIVVLFRWKLGSPPSDPAARAARAGDLGRASLRRDVAQHREGAAARLRLRPHRDLDAGAAAAGGARHHPGRPAALRRPARRLRHRRDRRRVPRRPAARRASPTSGSRASASSPSRSRATDAGAVAPAPG